MISARYGRVAMALHWAVALLAIWQVWLGWWMVGIPKEPVGVRASWFNLHKSIGLTLGVLMLARLAWRLTHRPPPLPDMPRWQALAARANHWALYALLIAQPVVGYLGSSFTRYPIKYFGHALPSWGWDAPALKDLCSSVHLALAWAITLLVSVHVAAALGHLVRRDGVFSRMWPAMLLLAVAFRAFGAAYVANEKSGTVGIIDTARDEVVGEIRTGTKPRGMAASLDGKTLYVSDQAANALLVVDVAKRAVVSKIDLGESPEGVYLSKDGKWIAAAVEVSNSVAFVDVAAGTHAFSVKTQSKNPEHSVFSPDGRWVFVSAEDADSVDVIDFAARKQVASIKVGRRPRGIGFTPDGRVAYVACEIASTIYAIDVEKQAVIASIPGGQFSNGVMMRPDGEVVFISNGKDGTVSVVDTRTNRIVKTIEAGKRPWNMAITPDGAKLYVANGRSNSVSVIDARAFRKLKDIPVGEAPWGVVIR